MSESPATEAPAAPTRLPLRLRLKLDPMEHAARLTAVLAVLAAVASGQYALQVSHTTLAQAEVTNQWGYYQSKSIKRNVAEAEATTIRALAEVSPNASEKLLALAAAAEASGGRYAAELDGIKAEAERLEAKKRQHQTRGDRFNISFVCLQAGVILATVANSARRKRLLLVLAIVAGLTGALFAGAAYLLP